MGVTGASSGAEKSSQAAWVLDGGLGVAVAGAGVGEKVALGDGVLVAAAVGVTRGVACAQALASIASARIHARERAVRVCVQTGRITFNYSR